MAQYIHPDIKTIQENPSRDDTVGLVIVPKEGRVEAVSRRIRQSGGEISERIPLGVLKATIPEIIVDELVTTSEIQAIHFDEEMRLV
jgi:hypothetical protein